MIAASRTSIETLETVNMLAPMAILGLWSLLLVGIARWNTQSPKLHRGIALSGVCLAILAAISLLGESSIDPGIALLGGSLVIDPLAALCDTALLFAILFALLCDRRVSLDPPATATALVAGAGLMLTIHAADLLPLVAGLEIGALSLLLLIARDPQQRPQALRWLVGQGILTVTLLFGVALLVAATGTTSIASLGARAAMIFTRWGAGPAQIAVDLLTSGVPIPEALEAEARNRAVTAMAPAALFLPGMLLTFAALALRFGAAFGHRLLAGIYEHASPAGVLLFEGLRLATLVALLRLFVTGLHVPRQLFAPYGWSTPAVLLIAATLVIGGLKALRGHEVRVWLAGQAIVGGGWLLLGALAAADFYAHAGLRGGAVTVIDHHEWGLQSGDAAIAALLALALTQLLASAGMLAVVRALGPSRPPGQKIFRGLHSRRPLLGWAAALLLAALSGAPPTALFLARFELLAAVSGDSNLPLRLLILLALLAAFAVGAAALRFLTEIFSPPLPETSDFAPAGKHSRTPTALAVISALLVTLAGVAPTFAIRGLELAACGLGMNPGPRSRGERLQILRARWATEDGGAEVPTPEIEPGSDSENKQDSAPIAPAKGDSESGLKPTQKRESEPAVAAGPAPD